MGGIGSGRRKHPCSKPTADGYLVIDIRRWKRLGLLEDQRSFGWQWPQHDGIAADIRVHVETDRVILSYKHRSYRESWQHECYPVYLRWTQCHLGGARPWFRCPLRGCGRRVALLYAGEIFACRHCHQLAYQSQRESRYDRALQRAEKIRDKLGWEPGILNFGSGKPKGMHWRTYERLTAQHDDWVRAAIAAGPAL